MARYCFGSSRYVGGYVYPIRYVGYVYAIRFQLDMYMPLGLNETVHIGGLHFIGGVRQILWLILFPVH